MDPETTFDGWVSVPADNGMRIRARLAERDGRMVVTGLHITGDHVTATTISTLHLARLEAAATAKLAQVNPRVRDEGDGHRAADRPVLERPERPFPDEFYHLIAGCYLSAAIETENPVSLLAREGGFPHETVRRWVKEARKRGYLPRGLEGRAG